MQLSGILWSFLGTCATDEVHRARRATTRGEDRNGVELLRKYHYDHSTGAAATEVRTVDDFKSFPQCRQEENLSRHIREWDLVRIQTSVALPDPLCAEQVPYNIAGQFQQ